MERSRAVYFQYFGITVFLQLNCFSIFLTIKIITNKISSNSRCAKMKRLTSILAKDFVCELCVYTKEGIVEPGEELSFFDQVDFVKSFCYLGDRLNANGGCEAVVTART